MLDTNKVKYTEVDAGEIKTGNLHAKYDAILVPTAIGGGGRVGFGGGGRHQGAGAANGGAGQGAVVVPAATDPQVLLVGGAPGRFYRVRSDPEREITVVCGATQAMMAALIVTADHSDEVLIRVKGDEWGTTSPSGCPRDTSPPQLGSIFQAGLSSQAGLAV